MTAATTLSEAPAIETAPTPATATKRRRTPLLIASLTVVASLVAGGWYLLNVGKETTDDAEVEGRVMNVAARVSGQVLHVRVSDNQVVDAGDVLVELDPADYAAKIDLARADLAAAKAAALGARSSLALTQKTAPANLLQATGAMTSAASSIAAANASIVQAKADLTGAESRRALAKLNLDRSQALLDQNAVATAERDERRTELDSAEAALGQAHARVTMAEASLTQSGGGVVLAKGRLGAADTSTEQVASAEAAVALADARVQQMESSLRLAELNLSYATVKAARRGVVSRRSVEEGQMVGPERSLMAVVPLDDVWVVANFKEDQLAEMAPGQPAKVKLDTFGGKELTGHVESIAGGTGARFALLPPDNATGNFVKVVQRVPVLVRIDDARGLELRPGMSADVTVRTAPR
jgi:membrane fusion protein (multidrug efflux system)